MKLHEKKIELEYAIAKMQDKKLFEIRKNDCDYLVGDLVHYTVVKDGKPIDYTPLTETFGFTRKKLHEALNGNEASEYFETAIYQITYITDYAQQDGYIVYGEKLLEIK